MSTAEPASNIETGGDMGEMKSNKHENGISNEEFVNAEKVLKQFPFYHGFIPREDLATLLVNNGEYLIRLSECDPPKGAPLTEMKKEIILSVNCASEKGKNSKESAKSNIAGPVEKNAKSPAQNKPKEPKQNVRNVIIHHENKHYYIESTKQFDSIKDLHDYYSKNYCVVKKKKFQLKTQILLQTWEHLHKDITLDKVLGEGAFGEVRQGVLMDRSTGKQIDVAIKLLKGTSGVLVGKEKIKEMMNEARLMRNFKHKNVVRMHGVAVQQQPIYIILELIQGGALSNYLKKNVGELTMKEKMNIAYGAALGVEFLHKNICIHRDLAARNCLYTLDKVVKISDFGLSKTAFHYVIKSATRLPIKWLAPETVTGRYFNFKTDIYSYGIILFEIYSEGGDPWDGSTTAEVKQALREGKFLSMPPTCPEKMSNFIKEKIYTTEYKRATMTEICTFFSSNAVEFELDKTLHEEMDWTNQPSASPGAVPINKSAAKRK